LIHASAFATTRIAFFPPQNPRPAWNQPAPWTVLLAGRNWLRVMEDKMGRGLLLWLIGIPLPIILLIWLFGGLN
jgi:hypothetical protein